MRRLTRQLFICAGLALTVLPGGLLADAPPPPDPPAVQAFASTIVAAPDDGARDRLLADAPPALRDHPQLGHALNMAWQPIIYTGDYARAAKLGEYTRHLMLSRGDAVDAAQALYLLGAIDGSRGDNLAALGKITAARRVFAAADDKDKIARAWAGEGLVRLQLGDFQQALVDTRRALVLYQDIHGKEGIINALNTSGSIFMAQGLTDRAMDYRQQALAAAGDDPAWQVYLFHNIANVYARRGERDKAIEWMSKSLAVAEKVGDKPNFAASLQELGGLHLKNGRFDLAESELRRALKLGEEIGDKRRQTVTLSSLGDLLRQRGDEKSQREALALAERAADIARETGEPASIWHSCTLEGRLLLALHQPERARAAFEESIAAIEDARRHLAADDVDATAFLEDKLDAYHGMVALLVQQNQPAQALAMAERAKARVLVEILSGPKLDPSLAMTEAERASTRRHVEEIAALNRQIASARNAESSSNPALLAELDAKLTAARRSRDDAESDFFIAHPELRNRQPPRGRSELSNAVLGSLLAPGKTALLEYVVANDETFLFVVTPATSGAPDSPAAIQAIRLPLERTALAARTEEFRATLAERSMDWETGARALGKDLLGPVRDICANSERLIIVPDGPLWELPFQALALAGDARSSGPVRTLSEACAVSLAPSLTFLAQPAAASLTHPPRLLAVGDPALATAPTRKEPGAAVLTDNEMVPLPDAERQVRALVTLYGAEHSTALLGEEAHEDTFKRLAGDYDVIHFATHGFLNDAAPMYSRLLMTQTHLAPDEDGLLEAWEWLPLRLHARLAVFSACETARGRVGDGEGVIGLSWALFRSGCPAVVVSQWKVDSASTTDLMIAFHQRLLAGEAPAEALRGAGLELAKRSKYRHPFYWAPFVLVGTGTPITGIHP